MSNNIIAIRKETAKAFFPDGSQWSGEVDVDALATLAKAAMAGSARSLKAAGEIVDGNAFSRWWNTDEMQRHMIQAISHLGEMSAVNLGLSAICNDLAAANLEHASRIDKNHHATNQQLNQVQQLTAELLTHLRKQREPALLERLLPALSKANPADMDAMRGWLRKLTEEIDLQYVVLQENVDKISQQIDSTAESEARLRAELASLSATLASQIVSIDQQLGQLSSSLSVSLSALTQRANNTDATIRKSHQVLAADLTTLNQQLARHQSEFQTAIQSEQATREAMQQSVVSLIKNRENAIRTTIGELNQHLLKRMLWGASGIVVLQILGFGYLGFKMGIFN